MREDGEVSLEVPFGPFFFGAGAAWRQQERPIRGRAKGGGAQRMMWGLTRGGWVYISRVGDSKMEIPVKTIYDMKMSFGRP